jgi:hypothetical protein
MTDPIEPTPKSDVKRIQEKTSWEVSSVLRDVRVSFRTKKSFDEIFRDRRTRRVFDPVTLRETRGFIQHVFGVQQVGKNDQAGRTRKAFISSGALHPVDVIILDGPDVEDPILFDDARRKFLTLPVLNRSGFSLAVDEARGLLPHASGHQILLVGDSRRLSASYLNSDSLLWRDAGAALQGCSLAASAYGYAFCPLGYTGSSVLTCLGPPNNGIVALGLGLFGR